MTPFKSFLYVTRTGTKLLSQNIFSFWSFRASENQNCYQIIWSRTQKSDEFTGFRRSSYLMDQFPISLANQTRFIRLTFTLIQSGSVPIDKLIFQQRDRGHLKDFHIFLWLPKRLKLNQDIRPSAKPLEDSIWSKPFLIQKKQILYFEF